MEIEELSNMVSKTSISSKFYVDNSLEIDNNYFITSVNLNFYQMWCMFNTMPVIYKSGKCKYEWKFKKENTDVVFCIYDWNNKNSLLRTKKWYIGSNTEDKVQIAEFLKILCDAVECYNKYYKCVEENVFTNNEPLVNNCLQEIKRELIKNEHLLRIS